MSDADRARAGTPSRPLSAPADVADAIAAAVAICWPGGTGKEPHRSGGRNPAGPGPEHAWRFSGRWWHAPVTLPPARPRSEAWR
ncbi:MAG: hypothetical protein ABSA65_10235 [Acidimicrobiales bacterium]